MQKIGVIVMKRKKVKSFLVSLLLTFITLFLLSMNVGIKINYGNTTNLSASQVLEPMLPIYLDGNNEVNNFPNKSGNGSSDNPYIIENLNIDANSSGSCIYLKNISLFLIIRNSCFTNGGTGWDDGGIRIENCSNIIISSCSIRDNNFGIHIYGSKNITIMHNIVVNNSFEGIALRYSNFNIIRNNSITNNRVGVFLNCDDNKIENNSIKISSSFDIFIISGSEGNQIYNNTILKHAGKECIVGVNHYDLNDILDNICVTSNSTRPILKNIEYNGSSLYRISWFEMSGALNYSLYRSVGHIVNVNELNPIYVGLSTYYIDEILESGTYYYTIVASFSWGDSSISNWYENIVVTNSNTDTDNVNLIISIVIIICSPVLIVTVTLRILRRRKHKQIGDMITKLSDLFITTNRVKIDEISKILEIDRRQFFDFIVKYNDLLDGFRILENYVYLSSKDDINSFTKILDAHFDSWKNKEKLKIGKV